MRQVHVQFAMLVAAVSASSTAAESAGLLRSLDFAREGTCVQAHLRLNAPVHAGLQVLSGVGSTVSMPVEVLGTADVGSSIAPVSDNPAGILDLSMVSTPAGPSIQIRFATPVPYRIITEAETKHIRIDVGKECSQAIETEPNGPSQQNSIARAKTEISRGNFSAARTLLGSLRGNAEEQQEIDELVGAALEGEGKLREAEAQYEAFLARYPRATVAGRVKQRLADVKSALEAGNSGPRGEEALPESLRDDAPRNSLALNDNRASLRGTIDSDTSLKSLRGIKEPPVDRDLWNWQVYGGLSQSHYSTVRFSDSTELLDNRLISSGSVQAKGRNAQWAVEVRADGVDQTGTSASRRTSKTSLSTAYVEARHRATDITTRIGRQTRNDGGILGRFDGVWLSLPANDRVSIGLASGSPVYLSDQLPFENDVYFGSGRLTFDLPQSNWFADLYAIEQHAGSIVDRRALGGEFRYESPVIAAYLGADYDINLQRLGSVYASATWQMTDRTVVNASLDRRTTPFLVTSNALSGQAEDDLPSLVKLLGEQQVLTLAGDRSADAVTAALGISYRLSETWQLAFDGLWMDVSGTPASGGVAELEEMDSDIYLSAYAYGVDIFKNSDSGGAGIAFSDSASSSRVTADLFWRYPWSEALTLSPRLRTSIRFKDKETSIRITPILAARYRVARHWLLESEFGLTFDSGGQGDLLDLQAIIGYRYEF